MRKHICLLALLCLSASLSAQEEQRKLTLSGSIQSDVLIPEEDEAIGAKKYNDWALTNTYADLNLNSEYIDAGARFEFLKHPLPGYENDIKGWGVPYVFVKGHYKNIEVTAGNFYEQFGSGFILRTYEERSLGIDNSLLGGRVVFRPFKGVTVKALTGEQRRYWAHNDSWITGGDVELNLDEWSKKLQEHGTYITLGASFVNKHEKADEIFADATHKLNMPENVNAFDVRARFQHGNVNILAEYAQKSQDPSFDNGYIYRKGNVAMLSASYSKRGMSLLLQAKRSDNMSFRSDRGMVGTSSFINHLPAFTMDHTYNLAAMYPYATQPLGEWAYQAEFGYTFKRKTFLGGKYGTSIKLNYSYVHGIDKDNRHYIVSVEYNKRPAPLTLYYTDPLPDAGFPHILLTDEGDLMITGGINYNRPLGGTLGNDNYSPLASVYLLHVSSQSQDQAEGTKSAWLWMTLTVILLTAAALLIIFWRKRKPTERNDVEVAPIIEVANVEEEADENEKANAGGNGTHEPHQPADGA